MKATTFLMSFFVSILAIARIVDAFTTTDSVSRPTFASSTTSMYAKKKQKGFGTPGKRKQKSAGQVQRDQASAKYDDIAAAGGQEYSIFVRQFGSDDTSWLPCGSIAVPRTAQVSDAIFANTDALKTSITRMYPKLQGYEEEFEFGYNLKIYPDDPVEVAMRGKAKSQGISVGNWISSLLSPIDASKVPPPPME